MIPMSPLTLTLTTIFAMLRNTSIVLGYRSLGGVRSQQHCWQTQSTQCRPALELVHRFAVSAQAFGLRGAGLGVLGVLGELLSASECSTHLGPGLHHDSEKHTFLGLFFVSEHRVPDLGLQSESVKVLFTGQ